MRPYSPCCSVSTPTDAAHLLRLAHDIKAGDTRLPARRAQHRGQHAHGGGLACPVGAQQRHHLPGRHLQVDAIHGDEAVEVLAEILGFDH